MDFIEEFYLDDLSICEKIIEFFETNPNQQHTGLVGTGIIDTSVKNSLDISIHPSQLYLNQNKVLVEYLTLLKKCVEKYIKKYPDCNEYSSWKITEGINIRRYEPGQSFSAWHTERCSTSENVRDRHLAFMTYLNSVQSGGGTEI